MSENKFNEGQYGLKPWAANLIMGILEFVMLVVWLLGSFVAIIGSVLSFDLDIIELDATITLALCGAFLFWNILVWCIKPLRTRFNYKETWWNLVFIGWLIVDTFILR